MPLGKYHCDYCDKQFQDTPSARRNHLSGVSHQRAKALWYDAVLRSSQFGLDEVEDLQSIGKGVCNRFVRTGWCQYGESCKYYHPKRNLPTTTAKNMEAVVFRNQMGASPGNLPPSLLPPPEGGYPPLPFVDWG